MYLLDVNTCCAFENLGRNQYVRCGEGRIARVPVRWLGFLVQLLVCAPYTACDSLPRASRTCPERSVPSGSVSDTISLNRGNLTYTPHP